MILMGLSHCCQYTVQLIKLKECEPSLLLLFLIRSQSTPKFHNKESKHDYFYSFFRALGGIFQFGYLCFQLWKNSFLIFLINDGPCLLFSFQGLLCISYWPLRLVMYLELFDILSLYIWIIFLGDSFHVFPDLFKKYFSKINK